MKPRIATFLLLGSGVLDRRARMQPGIVTDSTENNLDEHLLKAVPGHA